MSSKSESIIFSGRDDDFVYFAEQFKALIHSLKFGKVLTADAKHRNYIPTVRIVHQKNKEKKEHKL